MTLQRIDLYAVLGVPPWATPREIRRAYRTLLRGHHPDTRPAGDLTAAAAHDHALQRAFTAYAVLSDPARRARYDQRSAAQQSPLPRTGTPVGTTVRVRVRPVAPPRSGLADHSPIRVGPVRWSPSR